MSEVMRAASRLLYDGYSVFPVGRNKTPSGRHLPDVDGRRSWSPYRVTRPLETELKMWYGYDAPAPGIGIVCGAISRNLLVLDLESESAWSSLMFLAEDDSQIMQLMAETSVAITPSGGRHIYMHLQSSPPSGKVLARDPEGDVWIETRGEGQYVVAPGSLAEVHSSMRLYQWAAYYGSEDSCVWPDAAVQKILGMCEALNKVVASGPVRTVPTPRPGQQGVGQVSDGPGALYNQRGEWRDLLVTAGWTELGTHDGITRWRRPGKSDGCSATTGHCRGEIGGSLLYVFSSNALPFMAGKSYSLFGARALLLHGGDHSACARELRDLGYVSDTPAPCGVLVDRAQQAVEQTTGQTGEQKPRRYKYSSELRRVEDDKKWIVHGILSAGQTTILSAHPKAGKTTLLAHMIRALGTGEEFLERATRPCKVLVMSEEDEPTIADRIADLGIGDYCAWYVRPFPTRPTRIQWQEWVAAVVADCKETGAEVLIIDTMSRNLPISDENDATDVDNALQPLWALNREGIAIVLVHHIRKSVAAGDDTITSSRGSIAFNGFAEIILNLSKLGDGESTQRHLSGDSRASHVPKDLVIDLVDGRYVVAGDLRAAEAARDRAKLLAVLTADAGTAKEWSIKSELPQARTERLLHDLMVAGRVRQSGDGSRGSVYRYQLVEGDASCR